MSETPLTCPRCGAAADAGHDFCPKCGNALKTGPPPVPAGSQSPPRKPFPLLIFVLCALGAVALITAGAVVFSSKGPGEPASPALAGAGAAGAGASEPASAAPAPKPDHPIAGVFRCRKGAEFDVDPEDAIFAIDDVVIGKVDDFDGSGGGTVYYFRGQGTYIARLSMKGYRTAWVKIVVSPDASEEVVSVDTELRER